MRPRVRWLFRSSSLEIVDWRCPSHAGPFAAEEWNDAHEVVVPRRGAYVLRRAVGDEVLVDPGTVAFGHPGEAYRVRHPLQGGDVCSAFRLPPCLAEELIAATDPEAHPRPSGCFPAASAPLNGPSYLLHRLAVRAALDPGATPIEVEERGLAFVRAAVAGVRPGRPRSAPNPTAADRSAVVTVGRARELLARRYRERLTLASLALEVGCSPFHLCRLFTAVVGVPVHRALLRLRLRDALERLLDTRDGVSAIAYATGFASHSHLTDAFRREYGCPPNAVRRLRPSELRRLGG